MTTNAALRLSVTNSADALGRYATLAIHYDPALRLLSYGLKPDPRPCFSRRMLEDIRGLQRDVKRWCKQSRAAHAARPVDFLVAHSQAPDGVWLGGDLALFVRAIRDRNRDALTSYAELAVEVLHTNYRQLDHAITTVGFMRGDTLGAGFESALSCDLVVAEEDVCVGFPEILFNLFPGMGAYSFLARRAGAPLVERMIVSGKLYDCRELADLGAVDHLLPTGAGLEGLGALLSRQSRRLGSLRGLHMMRRRTDPVPFEELQDIAHHWVDTALTLGERELQRMDQLRRAQDRRFRVSDASCETAVAVAH